MNEISFSFFFVDTFNEAFSDTWLLIF